MDAKERPNGKTTDTEGIDPAEVLRRLKPMDAESLALLEAEEARRHAATCFRKVALDLGTRYTPELCSLKTFTVYHNNQKPALAAIKAFLGDLQSHVAAGHGIVLYGKLGTGKDHLLAACLYAAARQGYSCRWLNGQELYAGIRSTMDTQGNKVAANENDFMERWTEPEILGLSDAQPPVGELNAWRKELLYRLVDRRYRFLKPTWVTLNAKDTEEADQKVGQQVWDRLQEGSLVLPCMWPSHRARKK